MMNLKYKLLITGLIFGYLCCYMVIQDMRSNNIRNLGVGDGIYNMKDDICDQVDDLTGETFTDAQRDEYKESLKYIRSSFNPKNQITPYLLNQQDVNATVRTYIIAPMVFFVFTILSLLGWCLYCMCFLCDKFCPCCKIKKCTRQKKYEGCQLYWAPIGSLIFLCYIAVVCIVGLSSTGHVEFTIKGMHCALIKVEHVLTYGKLSRGWVGFEPLKDKLEKFNERLEAFLLTTKDVFTPSADWVTTGKTTLKADVEALKTDTLSIQALKGQWIYKNEPMTNQPIEISDQSNYFGKPVPGMTSSPYMINMNVLSIIIIDTAVPAIEVSTKSIQKSGESIAKSSEDIKKFIKEGVDSIDHMVKGMKNATNSTDYYFKQWTQYAVGTTKALLSIYSCFLGASAILGLALILLIICKAQKMRYVVHTSWCLFSIVCIFIFFFGTIFFAISIVGFDICDSMEGMLANKNDFIQQTDKIFQDNSLADFITTCKSSLGGNGDILSKLKVKDTINQINEMAKNISDYTIKSGKESNNSKDTKESTNKVKSLIEQFINIRDDNGYKDLGGSVIYDHPALLLTDYKDPLGLIEKAAQQCGNTFSRFSGDNWKYTKEGCGSSRGSYQDSDGSNLCLYIGGMTNETGVPNRIIIVDRYRPNQPAPPNDPYPYCEEAAQKISTLLLWRDEKNVFIQEKIEQANTLNTHLNDFINNMESYQNGILTYTGKTTDILSQVIDTKGGLLADINCLFIGDSIGKDYTATNLPKTALSEQSLNNVQQALCWGFFNKLIRLGTTLNVLAFGIFFGTFCIFMTAMKYDKNQELSEKESKSFDDMDTSRSNVQNTSNIELGLVGKNKKK